ncbi:MAG TPA: nickel-binding protein [Gaiellaceae bacterium]|nr:nickel-binding protein [Gaiellaceae bacterium]
MADFLVEVYTSRLDGAALAKLVARLKAAAEAMSAEIPVTYLRSIHVPEDETCFHLFEAESAEIVREAGRRAGLTFDRVAAAVEPVISEGGER